MRAVDAPRDPLLHHEPSQPGGVAARVGGGNLEDDRVAGFDVRDEMEMGAAGDMQLADDPVAVEHHPRVQRRRQRQRGGLFEGLVHVAVRHRVDPDDLHGEVVGIAALLGSREHVVMPINLRQFGHSALTADIAGFWRGAWADARRDMRGRYPKHPWPEDPWSAPPTARTKRRPG